VRHDDDHRAGVHHGAPLSGGAVLLGTAAFVLAWANAARGPFQWDDYAVIVGNPRVHALGAWAQAVPGGIRPALALSYALQWTAGAGPHGFHVFNVAVHAIAVVLVWRLCRRLAGPVPAAVAALVFAVHPVQTEAVTYVSGRSASLATLFGIAGLLVWSTASLRRFAALALFALALGCKETAIVWPAALLLTEVAAAPAAGWRAAFRRTAPAWLAAAVGLALVLASARYRELLAYSLHLRGPIANLPSGVQAIGYLLSRLMLVWRLSIDPALAAPVGWSPALAIDALLLVAAGAAALALLRRHPVPAVGILWFLLYLLPTTTFVARADVASERHLYPAMLGVGLLAGAGVDALRRHAPRVAAGVLAGTVLVLALSTRARNRDYESEAALWIAAARVTPTNSRAFNNLGWAWHRAGCFADARRAYERALVLKPDNAAARGNLAGLPPGAGAACATGWNALGTLR